jgi:hypothetical protein
VHACLCVRVCCAVCSATTTTTTTTTTTITIATTRSTPCLAQAWCRRRPASSLATRWTTLPAPGSEWRSVSHRTCLTRHAPALVLSVAAWVLGCDAWRRQRAAHGPCTPAHTCTHTHTHTCAHLHTLRRRTLVTPHPSAANFIAPGKRPLSAMSPIIVTHKASGRLAAVVGASGGPLIVSATTQTLARCAVARRVVLGAHGAVRGVVRAAALLCVSEWRAHAARAFTPTD